MESTIHGKPEDSTLLSGAVENLHAIAATLVILYHIESRLRLVESFTLLPITGTNTYEYTNAITGGGEIAPKIKGLARKHVPKRQTLADGLGALVKNSSLSECGNVHGYLSISYYQRVCHFRNLFQGLSYQVFRG
jgi:hypothetical protein